MVILHGLLNTILSQLASHRNDPGYRATLRELRLRLDAEAHRLHTEECEHGYAGQPTMKEKS